MTSRGFPAPNPYCHLEAGLREAMEKATQLLEPNSIGVLCRKPLLDQECPEVSDVDLISIWDQPEEYPERIKVTSSSGEVYVDILWVPASALLDSMEAASYGMLPHLLLESETVWARSQTVEYLINRVRQKAHEKEPWERRIGNQISFGDTAFKEAPRNLDFPPASLFFLQIAHSYYMMALSDCLRQSVLSLLTRPMTKLRRMDMETGCGLEELIKSNLHLEIEPSASLSALRRVHDKICHRLASQQLQGLSARTRGHYTYTISSIELDYRKAVAEALKTRGDYANANFYIRFWAYSLSRCPIVLAEAKNGRNPSFYVPYEPLKKSLLSACPEIIDDIALILGNDVIRAEAEESVRGAAVFRQTVLDQIERRGLRPCLPQRGHDAHAM